MGFFDDLRSMSAFKKIFNGGRASVSRSQITNILVSYAEMQRLPAEDFQKVAAVFNELRADTKKEELDRAGFDRAAAEVIRRFDAEVPFTFYSAGSEKDFNIDLDAVRRGEI